ncbi:uncharacterized protein LOC123560565 [Mercenaria mercenaria]|uniref:uncharacterized protein LOC123560565 n=1 Tax=Mercenaria mercenaria TaxID=6596 RepID=UPI00234E6141|nr:uncharacterized protein LOC123560565 [Mercenaria mercenaria]
MTELMGNRMKGSGGKDKAVKQTAASKQPDVDVDLEVGSKSIVLTEPASKSSVNVSPTSSHGSGSPESNRKQDYANHRVSSNNVLVNSATGIDKNVKVTESYSGTDSCKIKLLMKSQDSYKDKGELQKKCDYVNEISELTAGIGERKEANIKTGSVEIKGREPAKSENFHGLNGTMKTDMTESDLKSSCLEKERLKPKDIALKVDKNEEKVVIKKDSRDKLLKNKVFNTQTGYHIPCEYDNILPRTVELEADEKLKHLIETSNSEEKNLTEKLLSITKIIRGQSGETLHSELYIAALIKHRFTQKFEQYLTFSGINTISELNSLEHNEGKRHWPTVKRFLMLIWIACDESVNFCQHTLTSHLFQILQTDLKKLCFSKYADSEIETFTVKAILGILHNICRHVPNGKWKLRNDGLVSVVRLFLDSEVPMIRLKSLIILSYILSEAENEMINSDDDNFMFIFKVLGDALQSASHKSSKYGMSVVEIMKGLDNLAINDENKIRIVRNGGLALFQGILEEGSHDEVKVTITTLWSLAFHHYNKVKMREMPKIMSKLYELQHCRDEEICHAARGTFWELENISKSSIGSSVSSSLSAGLYRILYRFQWDSQAVMMKVKDRLRHAGYKVWMDIEHMTGSTLEAMALAVEKAAVVLVCMSQKYKDSPNCRTEAEYVYRLRKDFVPLRLQREYIPDGWLGILVGTRLYFDIYSEDQLDVQVPRLIRELRDRGKISPSLDQPDRLPIVPQRMTSREAVPILHHPASPTVSSWTPVDVKQWVGSIGLNYFEQNFEQIDGLLLLEIQKIQETAPEYFHNILREDFGMPVTEALKLSRHLRQLT